MKKVFIPILISAMLLGGLSAFAEKLDAPLASFDDLQTYSGVEFNKTEKMVSRFMKLWIPPKKVPGKS